MAGKKGQDEKFMHRVTHNGKHPQGGQKAQTGKPMMVVGPTGKKHMKKVDGA